MFSGIGGFELGIEKAYKKRKTSESSLFRRGLSNIISGNVWRGRNEQSSTCVGFSEVDKFAIQIYEKHFKSKNYGDCTKINWQEVEDFDLLTAGFPCQSFSLAGRRLGFEDTRGTLFFEIARCLKEKRPRYFLLENVKGLLSSDSGKSFRTIVSTLAELGYDIQWQVINSKNFGVPQSRPRVFIVGHIAGECRPKVFPIRTSDEEDCSDGTFAYSINSSDYRGANRNQKQTIISYAIDANYYKGPGAKDVEKCVRQLVHSDAKIRRLTPIECERLQGFPDDWTKYGIKEGKEVTISDTQRYKCLGNAVTVNVVEYVFGELLNG